MKQQLLEQTQRNALAAAKQALSRLEDEDYKHALDYLRRAISLLEG